MATPPRIHEIDFIRGIGVVLMVLFHIVFDLDFFKIYDFDLGGLPWSLLKRGAQIIFIVTAGITFTLSLERSMALDKRIKLYSKLKHVCMLFSFAMLITLTTWLLFGNQVIKFGILHFFVVATLLTIPLRRFGFWNSIIGILVIVAALLIPKLDAPWWLYPIGLNQEISPTFDYFPLLPWYGIFLQGVAIGSLFLKSLSSRNYKPFFRNVVIEKIGRRSLIIYLIHQPIIAGIIMIYLMVF